MAALFKHVMVLLVRLELIPGMVDLSWETHQLATQNLLFVKLTTVVSLLTHGSEGELGRRGCVILC